MRRENTRDENRFAPNFSRSALKCVRVRRVRADPREIPRMLGVIASAIYRGLHAGRPNAFSRGSLRPAVAPSPSAGDVFRNNRRQLKAVVCIYARKAGSDRIGEKEKAFSSSLGYLDGIKRHSVRYRGRRRRAKLLSATYDRSCTGFHGRMRGGSASPSLFRSSFSLLF